MAPPVIDGVRGDFRSFVTSVTVVRMRRRRDMIEGLRQWRRVRRQISVLARPPLLVRGSVSLRNRELIFVSVWPDVRSLLMFNGLGSHVDAVRWVIRGQHDTWTGIFTPAGRSDLSRGDGESHWLDTIDIRVSTRPGEADHR
jgi:hypothetical protein